MKTTASPLAALLGPLCFLGLSGALAGACSSPGAAAPAATPANREYREHRPLPQAVPACDPAIRYLGRFDFGQPEAPAFAFPASTIRASFTGGGIDLVLAGSDDRAFFNVVIDRRDLVVIQTERGSKTFSVARGLGPGTHSIEVFKRTETGRCVFGGFRLESGQALAPPPEPAGRRIEFYGDSITAGYGSEVAVDNPAGLHFTPRNENIDLAYCAVAARELRADYVAVCASGNGVFRWYSGAEHNTMPTFIHRIFADQPGSDGWDNRRWLPDAVVVCLGANDFDSAQNRRDLSPVEFDARFAAAYRAFVRDLRATYGPATPILLVSDVSRGYPPGSRAFERIGAILEDLVGQMRRDGDDNLRWASLFETNQPPYGEDWHPGAASHRENGRKLAAILRRWTGWD